MLVFLSEKNSANMALYTFIKFSLGYSFFLSGECKREEVYFAEKPFQKGSPNLVSEPKILTLKVVFHKSPALSSCE